MLKPPVFCDSVMVRSPATLQCTLGTEGVSKIHGFSKLTRFEKSLVADNVPALIAMAKKGSEFVKNN